MKVTELFALLVVITGLALFILGIVLTWQGYFEQNIYKLVTGGILLIYSAIPSRSSKNE